MKNRTLMLQLNGQELTVNYAYRLPSNPGHVAHPVTLREREAHLRKVYGLGPKRRVARALRWVMIGWFCEALVRGTRALIGDVNGLDHPCARKRYPRSWNRDQSSGVAVSGVTSGMRGWMPKAARSKIFSTGGVT